jgi:hypothetical protein
MLEPYCTCGHDKEILMDLFGPSLTGHRSFCPTCWKEHTYHLCGSYCVCVACGYFVQYDEESGQKLYEGFEYERDDVEWARDLNEAKVLAYQSIQPKEIGMSGFAAQLRYRPAWQEVVRLLRQGKDDEARRKSEAIRSQGTG